MVCCLLCFSDDPVEGDNYANGTNKFQLSMSDAPCKGQPTCCISFLCPTCMVCYARYQALDQDETKYRCCQGYFDGACCGAWKSGNCCEETCPLPCMFLEACICLGPSISTSRMYQMDRFDIQSDSCDRRIIRFSNCMQMLSCICWVAAIIDDNFRQAAIILDRIADCVFYSTVACQVSQVLKEADHQRQFGEHESSTVHPAATATPMGKEDHYYPHKG